ncbi:uncharacterized protein LOC143291487 [Babylonia areolata]|uniref:uncharacterized protein LOC143291487 n=1 Tax=Babylonia areolata TaxID=304850 RepID=UPI003FD3FC56
MCRGLGEQQQKQQQQVLSNMDGPTAVSSFQPSSRKPFKQVRYQDDQDRFEDRENVLPQTHQATNQQQQRGQQRWEGPEPQTQYILRSKAGSAVTAASQQPSQPVRGLNLPSGPSYDPEDEEDLQREATYQQELKHRVDSLQRAAESALVPQVSPGPEDSEREEEGEEFMERGITPPPRYRDHGYSHSHHATSHHGPRLRDGLSHHSHWADPLGDGYNPAATATSHSYHYADSERPGYADLGRPVFTPPIAAARTGGGVGYRGGGDAYNAERYQEVDYAAEPANAVQGNRYFHLHTDNVGQGRYGGGVAGQYPIPHSDLQAAPAPTLSLGGHSRQGYAEPRDGYYLTEPRGYAEAEQKPAHAFFQGPAGAGGRGGGDGEGEEVTPHHHHHHLPFQARPDDDDRYRLQEEDGAGLRPSPTPHHHHHQSGLITLPEKPDYDYVANNKADYGFSPKRTYKKIREVKKREEERLSHIFIQPKVKGKGKKGGSRSSSRDSSPARLPAITYSPAGGGGGEAVAGGSSQQGPEEVWGPQHSPHHHHLASQSLVAKTSPVQSPPFTTYPGDIIQPGVTQHLVTEDGQRISVDVNLRLVSPPLGSEGVEDFAGQQTFRQTGMQYPLQGGKTYRAHDSSGSHDYSDPVYTTTVAPTNPYKVIPPIHASSEGSPSSAPVQSDNGSYMLSYLREKEKQMNIEKPWYRTYGLKDYKRMQREVQLGRGSLGPDLENETFREKRDKLLRQQDYSKAVNDKNMKDLTTKKPATFPRQSQQDDMLSKRKLAVEYAKHVPKPTVKPRASAYNNYEMASQLSPIAKPAKGQQPSQDKGQSVEVKDLDKLHKRHEADKRSADLIQQKAQGVAS